MVLAPCRDRQLLRRPAVGRPIGGSMAWDALRNGHGGDIQRARCWTNFLHAESEWRGHRTSRPSPPSRIPFLCRRPGLVDRSRQKSARPQGAALLNVSMGRDFREGLPCGGTWALKDLFVKSSGYIFQLSDQSTRQPYARPNP